MGVIYFVGCKDCKIRRDLDKFYTLSFGKNVLDRKSALKYSEEDIKKDSFRASLLLSFLSQHYGHNIIMFDDYSMEEELYDSLEEEAIDFWSTKNET